MGIKFVYLLELRPDESVDRSVGFILDEKFLQPTVEETWEGVKVVADAVRKMQEIRENRRKVLLGLIN